ncbi:hypothetical protein CH251_01295 [Rhodococcus sp. 06-462-5]|uniref:putative immunity protein n=1 Tax=unclassified Rhodococcus (in: high G+C Gram-positive bacteria) TaxID=192944 RepID=UPI000B9BE4F3|nr:MULTISPECIES: hypothetical protein [unclassified Rhodococcus (in: high G+C Gram-positive bacteria)]OZC79543.1 hypothetical protein CH251_01295 [Rhodococcus sp. 06-462-5]OZE60100.1 hypothetical protein CH270_23235 [Rhodococcus sp. 02-925g]
MPEPAEVALSQYDIQSVVGFAATCARRALPIYEMAHPEDARPHLAIEGAEAFAETGHRTAELRRLAWDAHKAAREVPASAATDAAMSAMHAAGAAFLHPLYSPHQVKHILGSAVHLVLANPKAAAEQIEWVRIHADPAVRAVLGRFPPPIAGRTRFGVLMVRLDTELRR